MALVGEEASDGVRGSCERRRCREGARVRGGAATREACDACRRHVAVHARPHAALPDGVRCDVDESSRVGVVDREVAWAGVRVRRGGDRVGGALDGGGEGVGRAAEVVGACERRASLKKDTPIAKREVVDKHYGERAGSQLA